MSLSTFSRNWLWHIAALCIALVCVIIVWLPGYQLLIHTWDSNGTYTHSYLILPISLYLVWRIRARWLTYKPEIAWSQLIVIFFCGLIYSVGYIGDLAGLQHAASIFIIMTLVVFFVGYPVTRILFFPITYLVFAIPFGEFLLPYLMNFTADFTVFALQVVGIPVYREGLYFSLPSGNWSVVEACSGLRYLIASLALGVLYAYLNYRSWKRRVIFVVICAIVPIFANGIRAFIIVTLGHISNMRLAVGIDHYIYGWLFFMLVIFLLFWIGSFWREDTQFDSISEHYIPTPLISSKMHASYLIGATMCAIFFALLAPLTAEQFKSYIGKNSAIPNLTKLTPPTDSVIHFTDFIPYYKGARAQVNYQLQIAHQSLGIFVAYYSGQDAEHKLISITNNLVVTLEKQAALLKQNLYAPEKGDIHLPQEVIESYIRYNDQYLLSWHWYEVCGQHVTNETYAKWLQLKCTFTKQSDNATVIVLYVPIGSQTGGPTESQELKARTVLQMGLNAYSLPLQEALAP